MRSLLATAFVTLSFGAAHAHIHLVSPLSRTDSPTGDQKAEHCGVAGQGRTARVTTLLPGATITVSWMETINHPGYFRIAFQPDGEIFGIPAGDPPNFPVIAQSQTGMTDAAGALILADFIPDGTSSTTVTLPDMECSNCTLQFIQVMTDKPPYTVTPDSDDIYFNCADITLSASAPPTPDGPGTPGPDAGVDQPQPEGGVSGCSTSGGAPTAFFGLGVVGLLLRLRRRR